MTNKTVEPKILYLSRADVHKLEENSSDIYIKGVERALTLHSRKDFSQPLKPYLKTNKKDEHIADRIIAMPAHLGEPSISGIKWIGSKHDNPSLRNMERASALIVLNDPQTNFPIAILEGSSISAMRTAAVSVVATRHLANKDFRNLSIVGCGLIAKMHVMSMLENFKGIKNVVLYDVESYKAQELMKKFQSKYKNVSFRVADKVQDAVEKAEVLVTCTVTNKPYIKAEWIQKGTFISNVSIMDLESELFIQADKVIVDDWDQANREKKVINQLVLEGKFSKEMLHAELGDIITGLKAGREHKDELIILNPMGMAIEDISCAYEIYENALKNNIGKYLNLY
ncbi:2,3-diaminopropionate biosynthesis protein SbnB [Bacillus wiedmannii]|uniref:2,3-diaminopropionate biosynthesis protein SbnB n=1 Tax=Bacillus wiedmannii TaxID=1890302 RepID=UPI0035578F78